MTDIFINYAREDEGRVKEFVSALEQQGWSAIMGSGLAITHLHSLLPCGWAEQGNLGTVKRDPGV